MLPTTPSKHVSSQVVHKQKWLQMSLIKYQDENQTQREWESCERTTRKTSSTFSEPIPDGVEMICEIQLQSTQESFICVCVQYRPPIQNYCIEFPAGLIELSSEGDSKDLNTIIIDSALRELYEETGLTMISKEHITSVAPLLVLEPGMSNATTSIVHFFYSVTDENVTNISTDLVRQQHLEESEQIYVHFVSKKNFLKEVMDLSKQYGNASIDCKLYMLAAAAKLH